jgi:NAD(P)H-dependent FMN reductase
MSKSINVALIYGSVREGRFCDKVADWAAAEIQVYGGYSLDRIDPKAHGFGAERIDAPTLNNIRARLASADAFVVVTPEYNHGYPGALKLLIDTASREWHAKPVAFVSYGGISGGLRAVEQLRLVFAELHATTIRDSVSFANVWELFDSAGQPPPSANKAMSALLRQLSWWAHALRDAREAGAYLPAAA